MSDDQKVVIVTGSRSWSWREHKCALNGELDRLNPDVVVCGGAIGADFIALKWCETNGKICRLYYPDYTSAHGTVAKKRAPLVRNIAMLDDHLGATVVACPLEGGTGTLHTMRHARSRLMEVIVLTVEE